MQMINFTNSKKKLFESSRPVISLHILNQFLNNYTF